MDTHGHEDISKIGQELLKEAFKNDPQLAAAYRNEQGDSLNAFHMGNWFTDLTQIYDEVTFSGVHHKAQELLAHFNHMLVYVLERYLAVIPSTLADKLKMMEDLATQMLANGIDPK